jgi:hypothetical protein
VVNPDFKTPLLLPGDDLTGLGELSFAVYLVTETKALKEKRRLGAATVAYDVLIAGKAGLRQELPLRCAGNVAQDKRLQKERCVLVLTARPVFPLEGVSVSRASFSLPSPPPPAGLSIASPDGTGRRSVTPQAGAGAGASSPLLSPQRSATFSGGSPASPAGGSPQPQPLSPLQLTRSASLGTPGSPPALSSPLASPAADGAPAFDFKRSGTSLLLNRNSAGGAGGKASKGAAASMTAGPEVPFALAAGSMLRAGCALFAYEDEAFVIVRKARVVWAREEGKGGVMLAELFPKRPCACSGRGRVAWCDAPAAESAASAAPAPLSLRFSAADSCSFDEIREIRLGKQSKARPACSL